MGVIFCRYYYLPQQGLRRFHELDLTFLAIVSMQLLRMLRESIFGAKFYLFVLVKILHIRGFALVGETNLINMAKEINEIV